MFSSCTIGERSVDVESVLSEVLSSDYTAGNHTQEKLNTTLEFLVRLESRQSLFKRNDISADVSLAKGIIYLYIGDNVSALNNFKKAKSLYVKSGNIPSYITSQLYIAKLYRILGDVPRSLFVSDLVSAKVRCMSTYQLALLDEVRKSDYVSPFAYYNQYDINPSIYRIETEYVLNKHIRKQKLMYSLLIAIFSIIFLCCLYQSVKYRQNKSVLENELKKSRVVRRKLALTQEVLGEVDYRLHLLDNYIVSVISGNYLHKANTELSEMLEDKEYFLKSTIDRFLIAHPNFVMHLRELQLSDEEIACCCMFASGMKGKDIAHYMGWTRGYDKISRLRDALGIKGSTSNIDTYLKQKMILLDEKSPNQE